MYKPTFEMRPLLAQFVFGVAIALTPACGDDAEDSDSDSVLDDDTTDDEGSGVDDDGADDGSATDDEGDAGAIDDEGSTDDGSDAGTTDDESATDDEGDAGAPARPLRGNSHRWTP